MAYHFGLAPSMWAAAMMDWPPAAQAAVGVVLGAGLLASLGTAE